MTRLLDQIAREAKILTAVKRGDIEALRRLSATGAEMAKAQDVIAKLSRV